MGGRHGGKHLNTPAHLIFGAVACGDPQKRAITAAAIFGALVPDLSLYLLAGWELQVKGTAPEVVFGQMYFSDAWQSVFRIDNSFVLWGIALVIGVMAKSRIAIALCGAALLHLAFDFPLHNDDARAHFWPVTNWTFHSPVSYWDPAHHGRIVGFIEIAMVWGVCVYGWRKFHGRLMRGFILAMAVMETAPLIMFSVMFAEKA
jgi:hypothetical protein